MSLVTEILNASQEADLYDNDRGRYSILSAITSEVGELATEVAIAEGDSYKKPGPDGVVGEAIDVMISALDIIYKERPNITEHELVQIAVPKLVKWISKLHNEAQSKRDPT